jgi:hypothetical protein
MVEPRFRCACGHEDKALNRHDLIVAIQLHNSMVHQRWPTDIDVRLNPAKWGITHLAPVDIFTK